MAFDPYASYDMTNAFAVTPAQRLQRTLSGTKYGKTGSQQQYAVGSFADGFAPTTTLVCSVCGCNSISENLDYKHLMNVSRIGKIIPDKAVPTDEEIWA